MTPARRSVAILAVIGAAMLTYGVWYVFIAHATPPGYEFPQHELSGSGPTAEWAGKLSEADGCVLADGATVVWPRDFWLALDDGALEVHGEDRVVTMGQSVRLGGGSYSRDQLAEIAADAAETRCPEPFFLATGFAD